MAKPDLQDEIPVTSSNLATVYYDSLLGELYVRFKSGVMYCYYGVPKAKWAGLLAASSKGKYLHQHIKGTYSYAIV